MTLISKVPSSQSLTARIVANNPSRYTRLPGQLQSRSIFTLKDDVFSATATAEGAGWNGTVKVFGDSPFDLKMSEPKKIGGKGDGQNPEQLLAASYSSCFLGSLQYAAARAGKKEVAENAKVSATVFLGNPADSQLDGWGLRAELTIEGCNDDAVIKAAHAFCPFSRALNHGINLKVVKG